MVRATVTAQLALNEAQRRLLRRAEAYDAAFERARDSNARLNRMVVRMAAMSKISGGCSWMWVQSETGRHATRD